MDVPTWTADQTMLVAPSPTREVSANGPRGAGEDAIRPYVSRMAPVPGCDITLMSEVIMFEDGPAFRIGGFAMAVLWFALLAADVWLLVHGIRVAETTDDVTMLGAACLGMAVLA